MRTPPRLWNILKQQILKKPQGYAQDCYRVGSIMLIVTSRCNFLCKHCLRDFNETSDLPFEIAENILDRAWRYNYWIIGLVGGEPFLYPRFHDLFVQAVRRGYKLKIITNGFLFKEHSKFLIEHRTQIQQIVFSLESLDAKKHDAQRHTGSHAKLLEAFRTCRAAKIPFACATTIGPHNFDEIYDLAIFGKKMGMQNIVLSTMMPCPRTEANQLVLNAQQRRNLYQLIQEIPRILKFNVGTTAEMRAHNNIQMCMAHTLSQLSFNSRGEMVLCCDLANYDNNEIQRKTIIASLKDKTFDEALQDLSRFLDRYQRQRIADFCNHPQPDHIDFNSCFYCLQKLTEAAPSPSSAAA